MATLARMRSSKAASILAKSILASLSVVNTRVGDVFFFRGCECMHARMHALCQWASSSCVLSRLFVLVCMHACVYVCVHGVVYMYVCMRVYMYACMHLCVCLCVCVCMRVCVGKDSCVCVYIRTHACQDVCMYACTLVMAIRQVQCAHAHVYIPWVMHIRTLTYKHKHTYEYALACLGNSPGSWCSMSVR